MKHYPDDLKRLIDQEVNLSDIVKLLLEQAAKGFIKNKFSTILHEAVRGNEEEVIKLILDNIEDKKDIDAKDNEGDTPLMWAVIDEEKVNAAKILLEYGASVDAINNDGQTTLHKATEQGYLTLVQLLLDKRANPDIKDKDGRTPLYYAVQHDFYDIARALLNKGADINPKDKDGKVILDLLEEGQLKEELLELYRQQHRQQQEAGSLLSGELKDVDVVEGRRGRGL